MSWQSFPARTPAWLIRHPLLLSHWIGLCARANRAGAATVATTALCLSGAGIALLAIISSRTHWLVALNECWILIFVVAVVHAAAVCGRRRRRFAAEWSQSWLAALPVAASAWKLNQWMYATWPLLAQGLMAAAVLLILGAMAERMDAALPPSAAVACGLFAGILIGALMPGSKQRVQREASRYAPGAARRDTGSWHASTSGLAAWPVARAISMGRPENSRLLFLIVASFAIQAGTSVVLGLAIIGMWFLAAYLASLLTASVFVARDAGKWLRATPMSFVAFAWPLARRALLHQLIGTITASGALVAGGIPLPLAARFGAFWLALVIAVAAIALTESYRGRSPAVRLALSVTAIAGLELRSAAWSIPAAVMIAMWHVREGVKRA